MKRCPKCGLQKTRLLALSRVDNKTMICDECGTLEAMQAFTEYTKKKEEKKC